MRSRTRERLFSVLRLLGVVGLLVLFGGLVYWIFYASLNAETFPDWTGFNTRDAPDDTYSARTLWDWLSLLLVPFVLAGGGLLFTWFENRQTRVIERERVSENQKIEEERLKKARELEDNRAQDAIVRDYLDQMTELLLNHALRVSSEDNEVRSVARARTLTALRGVDGVRKATIVQFLYEARLIMYMRDGVQVDTVVQLNGADLVSAGFFEARLAGGDLSGAYLAGSKLTRADLGGARLAEADLTGADLIGAYLGGANFSGANLFEADLSGAYLAEADLVGADLMSADLVGADLMSADLSGAVLAGVHLTGADLIGARLAEVHLTGADLTGAVLAGVHLTGSDLTGSDLTGANLFEADLEGAKLIRAYLTGADLTDCRGLTISQLLQAESLHGAILPDYINPADLGDKWSPPKQ